MSSIIKLDSKTCAKSGGKKYKSSNSDVNSALPLVSVITVVLNGCHELERTMRSVACQSYTNVEYIVIDGGSTDGTLDLLELSDDLIDCWISEPDQGISDAFNKGIRIASGDWIMLLNAGDCFFCADSIASFAQQFVKNHWIVTAFAKTESGVMPAQMLSNRDELRKKSMISHQGTVVHRKVYEDVGLYNTSYKIRMDYEFWLRSLRRYQFTFIDEVLIDYAPNGISARSEIAYYLEEHRANMWRCENPKQFLGAFVRYMRLLPEFRRLRRASQVTT